MARTRTLLMSVFLAVMLASCCEPKRVRIVLEGSAGAGSQRAADWERFINVVESTATTERMTPLERELSDPCRLWSTDKESDGLILDACPDRDVRGTRLPTVATVFWIPTWWNPIANSRATTIRSNLIGAMRAEFGDRIKVTQ